MIGCEDLPKWGGEKDFCKLLIDLFEARTGLSSGKSLEVQWIPISAISGTLPDEEELKNYDGFVMSGSHYSVEDNEPWMLRLQEWVRKVKNYQDNNNDKVPKIVAVCFSHQLVNKAFGGTVGQNPQREFVWNAENIQLTAEARKHEFFNNNIETLKDDFNLFESHGECVLAIPPGAVKLASSHSCEYEIVGIGNNIITMQNHPEITAELMTERILPSLKAKGLISDETADKSIASFKNGIDDELFISMIKLFFAQ